MNPSDVKKQNAFRRHYLNYLPYYFGFYSCINCGIKFETKLRLQQHTFSERHKRQTVAAIETKRQEYFNEQRSEYIVQTICLERDNFQTKYI